MINLFRFIIIWAICFSPQGILADSSSNYFSIVDYDDDSIILDLTVPEPDIEEIWEEGILYHRIKIPGFVPANKVGIPQLLHIGTLIGIPDDATPIIKILDSDSVILPGYNVYPAPRPIIRGNYKNRRLDFEFVLDRESYKTQGFIPSDIAIIDYTGYMRDQRVARIMLSAFQVNPVARNLRYYSRIRVKITFYDKRNKRIPAPVTGRAKNGRRFDRKDSAYRKILKGVLLNHDQINGRNK